MVACHDVEKEGFSPFGSDEDWCQRQRRFEALQSLLCFLSLDKSVCLFEKLVERHPPFAEPRDESAQDGQTAGAPLYALDIEYGAHGGNGRDLFGVGLYAMLGHDVSKQLPLRKKTHFSGFNLMLNLWRFMNVAAKFAIRSQA